MCIRDSPHRQHPPRDHRTAAPPASPPHPGPIRSARGSPPARHRRATAVRDLARFRNHRHGHTYVPGIRSHAIGRIDHRRPCAHHLTGAHRRHDSSGHEADLHRPARGHAHRDRRTRAGRLRTLARHRRPQPGRRETPRFDPRRNRPGDALPPTGRCRQLHVCRAQGRHSLRDRRTRACLLYTSRCV